MTTYGYSRMSVLVFCVLLLIGCSPSQQQIPLQETAEVVPTPVAAPSAPECAAKDCFVSAANDCKEVSVTLTEEVGVFNLSSSDCIFTKKVASLNENTEMRTLLAGKSLTCKYGKGKFDQRWVSSLLGGIDACTGDLKYILVDLLVFS
ncbi:hypothetical protein HY639_00045 [Candidatus Woesearchaeota archaeon]|nr:hypothetical protein [Candidatus Woesearchaeota archaeon]